MRYGVLGTGSVGQAIAGKLVTLGHDVMMGSRGTGNPRATAWAQRAGQAAQVGTFVETAVFGELVFNCTHGASSLDVLGAVGEAPLAGKILVDVANILLPDTRGVESLGEQIQNALPRTHVVKTLNTINCEVMVDPARVSGSHTVFMSGDNAAGKKSVRALLEAFGWRDIVDLGGIATARATEDYLPLWLALSRTIGSAHFNIKVVRSAAER